MIDPDDPKQARDYRNSGYLFVISIIILTIVLVFLACYIYINKPY